MIEIIIGKLALLCPKASSICLRKIEKNKEEKEQEEES